ncbi:MAG: DUF2299 family protein [Candidatus Sulfotelmatobacter sp.]
MPMRNWAESITHNVVGSVIATIVAGISAAVWAFLAPAWRVPIVIGLVFGVGTLLGLYLLAAIKRMPPVIQATTTDNVEHRVREWLDRFNLTIKRVPDAPDGFFAFEITTAGQRIIRIARMKDKWPEYLHFGAAITFAPEIVAEMQQGTQPNRRMTDFLLSLRIELTRIAISYAMNEQNNGIILFKRIPITSVLNEHEVIETVWEMDGIISTLQALTHKLLYLDNERPA